MPRAAMGSSRPARGWRAAGWIQAIVLIASLLAPLAVPGSVAASTVSSAAFTGGAGTVSVSGTLYAKNGGALTLAVTTSSDTKCVDVTGAFTGHQTSTTAKSSWTFSFTASAGDGVQTVTAAASPNFNANNCTGQSQNPLHASFVLDNTAPTVTGSVSPVPNAAGWNNSNAAITWAASDAGSGVASGPTPATDSQTSNTAGVTKTATATDRLGNVGSGSVTIKLDKTAPTITGSRSPAANANGWNNTDVTASFTCSDATSGIKSCSGPTILTTSAANQSVTGAAVDNADNSASATVGGINIDKVAPTLSGAPASAPNAAGWYNSNVTIHWTASDALSGIQGSAPADSTISSEGSGLTATASVSDNAGNSTTATSSPSVKIDKTAPNTAATAPANWNNTNVTVSLSSSDALSGVASTFSILDGGSQESGTSITISSEGDHILQFWSVDNAGNVESTKSVHVKIDKTPPTINHTQSPLANANGWNNSNVTVTFTCGDALSGVASCTSAQTVTTEGQNQLVTGTATDNAGNSATDPATVSIDKTPPTISGAADRAPNANGWYNADVTVTYTCGDALSGIATCPVTSFLGEGASQSATGTAIDAAGNTASATISGINVDKTAPTISGAPTSLPNANGWHSADVTIHWTCSDALSGISGICPADSVITGEGDNLSASASVSDLAGNTTSTTVSGIKIDRTPPSTSASVPGPLPSGWYAGDVPVTFIVGPDLAGVDATYYSVDGGAQNAYSGTFLFGAKGVHTITFWSLDKAGNLEDKTAPGHTITLNIDGIPPTITGSRTPTANVAGWNNSPVTVSFTCSDAESGIASCSDPTTLSGEGAGQSVTGTATDNAGNSASATVSGIDIDTTAPLTTASATPSGAWVNASVAVTLNASDNLSGVDQTFSKLDGGAAATGSSVAISGEGVHTLDFWSTDLAGNVEATKSVEIKIDKTAPTITHTQSPAANAEGWNNADVTVTFSCEDQVGLSGVASCAAPVTVSTEGASQSVGGTATDNAGNTSTDTAHVNIDKTPPSISGSQSPVANANGWNNTDVTVGFSCNDALSGIASCAAPVTLSTEAAGQSASGTATDKAGNSSSATVSGINIDKTAPVLSGTPTTAANSFGWYKGPVTIQWSASDDLSGIDGSAPNDSTISGEGTSLTATASVSDKAGNATTAHSSPVDIDTTAPLTTASATPSGAWVNASVAVTLNASDNLSGVDQTFYALDGGATTVGTSIAISAEGLHHLDFWSTDKAGNVESANHATIQIDKTKPTITHTQSPAANGDGWNNADVTVTFSCADALSGIASCAAPVTVSTEGASQSVGGTATDNAGNTSTDTAHVNIDKTPPSISGSQSPVANANGWNNTDVTVGFSCNDSLSGVTSCTAPVTLSTEAAGQSVSGTATDKAGNSSSATVSGINIDKTAPSISGAADRAPNSHGWYNAPVTVSFTCGDGLSGIASCSSPQTRSAEGAGQTATGTAVDKAGNSSSASVTGINIDLTSPGITAAPDRSANANGWYNADVTFTFSCSDDLSGVASCPGPQTFGEGAAQSAVGTSTDNAGNGKTLTISNINVDKTAPTITGAATTSPNASGWYTGPVTIHFTCSDSLSGIAVCPADVTLNTDGTNQSVSGTATDKADNSASATVSGINIDKSGPVVTVTGVADHGAYILGAVPSGSCVATDATSGIATGPTFAVTGGLANGVGTYSFSCTATDHAGNSTTVGGSYRVTYRFDGFLQPINDTAHQTCLGCATSIFKGGSTVPAKFQLMRADGTIVQANSLPVWLTPTKGSATTASVDENLFSDTATSGSTYRWDATTQQYIYNWSTKGFSIGYYWRIGVTLDDGQTYYVNIGLR